MQGLMDIDRNFLASINMAEKAMSCQFIAPILHAIVCYYLTIIAGYGIVGTGFSNFITNSVVFLIQNYFLRRLIIT